MFLYTVFFLNCLFGIINSLWATRTIGPPWWDFMRPRSISCCSLMWCLQESACWMLNGRWITLQSGIDYLPLEAKPLFSYYLSVSANMMLYLNSGVA